MVAISGLFVLSQAADVDPRWRYLHYSVTWVVPACGLVAAFVIGYRIFVEAPVTPAERMWAAPALLIAAILCAASAARPVANLVAVFLFRGERPSHTLRLAARITLAILALALPGWFALRTMFDQLFDASSALIDQASLEAQLVGYLLLAIASVGLLIRRDLKEHARPARHRTDHGQPSRDRRRSAWCRSTDSTPAPTGSSRPGSASYGSPIAR